jgi:predicted PurR-regulated permease PerM
VIAIVGYFIFQSLNLLYLIITAFIISMAMENVVSFFQRWFSRGFSIGISYFILILFVLSGLVIVVPFVIQQFAEIINMLVIKVYNLQQMLQQQGLEVVIMQTSLPSAVKSSLIESISATDR